MDGWTIPAKSINAVALSSSTEEIGATIDFHEVKATHACEAVVTATAAGDQCDVHLEGSLDGTNFYVLATAGIPAGGAAGPGTVSVLLAGPGAARYVRTTVPGGGSIAGTPTLTTLLTSS
jgi:hypothetical protein